MRARLETIRRLLSDDGSLWKTVYNYSLPGHAKVLMPPCSHHAPAASAARYQRHRPEQTPLYRLVQQHARTFTAHCEAAGTHLPRFVTDEFDAYLACGILAHGFLRLTCDTCAKDTLVAFSCKRRGFCPSCGTRRMNESAAHLADAIIPRVPVRQWVLSFPIPLRSLLAVHPELLTSVLAVVQRAITSHHIQQAGVARKEAHTGSVTLIQRFGSAANLNIHLHGLWLDGVYQHHRPAAPCASQPQATSETAPAAPTFHETPPPTPAQLAILLDKLIKRILKLLTKSGYLIEAEGTVYLANTDPDNPLAPLQAASATWRIAQGPRAGQKVLRLVGSDEWQEPHRSRDAHDALCANAHGFSLDAGVRCEAHDRQGLEQLCRYITRPAISNERLRINAKGQVILKLKTPWKDGTSHIVLEPLEFMQRLAALVPRPRLHLTRFHGVLAPNAKLRSKVVPGASEPTTADPCEHAEHRAPVRMSWARMLKRVFDIEIERCACGGKLKLVAAIEQPDVIEKILTHLGLSPQPPPIAPARREWLFEAA